MNPAGGCASHTNVMNRIRPTAGERPTNHPSEGP
ncbi:hypothetical protein STVIR_3783 [Streptomyces viridochromogenes Tue57]|uniref:Uncharacterized protein n=1 Tax=Streptomyces viridochromogenes Tue57 TaxID=1160705 RepID=L8PGC6_STRVR|nr:hypothetical protein STVIR_3783 [Streptomyces viridochromogenes Tue57]